jgi:hypothetical protein
VKKTNQVAGINSPILQLIPGFNHAQCTPKLFLYPPVYAKKSQLLGKIEILIPIKNVATDPFHGPHHHCIAESGLA